MIHELTQPTTEARSPPTGSTNGYGTLRLGLLAGAAAMFFFARRPLNRAALLVLLGVGVALCRSEKRAEKTRHEAVDLHMDVSHRRSA